MSHTKCDDVFPLDFRQMYLMKCVGFLQCEAAGHVYTGTLSVKGDGDGLCSVGR